MISFITENVFQPWSKYEIQKFEAEGSQRDTVIYNSHYDSRIMLTDKNLYQCSIRINQSKYKNFYLLAVRRNLFYFIIYVPQMDIIKELKSYDVFRRNIDKLPTIKKFITNSQIKANWEEQVQYSGENCVIVKVDASVEDFLFPRRGYITDDEILKKYALLNDIYSRCLREFEGLKNYCIQLKDSIERKEKIVKKILIRKATRVAISVGLAALTGILVDFDSILGFEDLEDAADLLDVAEASESYELAGTDYIDWSSSEDLLTAGESFDSGDEFVSGDSSYNVVFGASSKEERNMASAYLLDELRKEGIHIPGGVATESQRGGFTTYTASKIEDAIKKANNMGYIDAERYKKLIELLKKAR